MSNRVVYEYAIIRLVPNVERQEFINAGLVLFCKPLKIILCKTLINREKIHCFDKHIDIEMVQKNLQSFEAIALGTDCGSPVARYDLPARFRWLTAAKSTIIQCSPVHPGLADNVEVIFTELFKKLVK